MVMEPAVRYHPATVACQPHGFLRWGLSCAYRSDQQEFYQLLSYKGDVDLEAKLDEWERFYNFARPHGAHNGQTPYEALRDKLQ